MSTPEPPETETPPAGVIARLQQTIVRGPRRTYDSLRRKIKRLREKAARTAEAARAAINRARLYPSWMKLGSLNHYAPRPLKPEEFPQIRSWTGKATQPSIGIVTPSFRQAQYITATLDSVLDQQYPNLQYRIQDGGSTDGTVEILQRYAPRLTSWVSEKDGGQADAVTTGLALMNTDIMAWLNSDDLLMPGALNFIGQYFAQNPKVDAIYGHRVLIDEHGQEIGRWVLPAHRKNVLPWVDYVPQETLFWRRSLYEKVGGVNRSFQFALDWDLLLRFEKAGARIVRVPYYIGCFRIHSAQKTSSQISSVGQQEMDSIYMREHGRVPHYTEINRVADAVQYRASHATRMLMCGLRR
ncbi:MAG TPA: glycosyltransferase family 2 protein [Candidatus Methylacidiphilales bacterium]|nr:glycosyltransferase family 2 protein [Candidatus Methylacidiphilales bacterium]